MRRDGDNLRNGPPMRGLGDNDQRPGRHVMARRTRTWPFVLAGVLAGTTAAQAEVTRVEVMADSCLACHGAQAQGPGPMPAINDLTEQGIVNKLMTFRKDEAADATLMNRHAPAYSREEIRAIAAHIANIE